MVGLQMAQSGRVRLLMVLLSSMVELLVMLSTVKVTPDDIVKHRSDGTVDHTGTPNDAVKVGGTPNLDM